MAGCTNKQASQAHINESIQSVQEASLPLRKQRDIKIDSLVRLGKTSEAAFEGREYQRKVDSLMKIKTE